MHWLLLRGLAREQRHWGAFPDALRARLPRDTVHTIDLPGAGTEHKGKVPPTVAAMAEDVRHRWGAVREANPGPWGLLGISLGGMVAMQWVSAHPTDFERVVLANTSARNVGAPWRRMRLGILPGVLTSAARRDPVARERRILGIITNQRTDLDEIAPKWAEFQRDQPMTRANVLRQVLAATKFRAPDRMPIPSLIIVSEADRLCHPSCGHALATRFGTRVASHPKAGHDVAMDATEWLADQVAGWARESAASV